jgi:hypothetical protein
VLPFKFKWRQVPDVSVPANRIVEHFDVIKYVTTGIFSIFVGTSFDPLTLYQLLPLRKKPLNQYELTKSGFLLPPMIPLAATAQLSWSG